jgi:fermentation-respiration switch protein FrsA (DUF1100 family)
MLVPLLLALIVLAVLILVGAWVAAGHMIKRRTPDSPHTPGDLGLPYEVVSFPARDGVRIGGWRVGSGDRPTVIFCPGWNGSMDGDTHFLPWFDAAGFDVLQFDWRAHGASEGDHISLGVLEIDDLLGALDFLEGRGVTRVGLMGFSMGGAIALRGAARDQRVACVVCDGGFVHFKHAIAGGLRRRIGGLAGPLAGLILWMAGARLGGIDLRESSPLAEVAAISPRPVLFIHGGRDRHVPMADQEAIFAAAGEPKSLWRVDAAGHREAHKLEPDTYRDRVMGFFKEGLH